ncbi:hypothetical protein, partial [Serratia marcescens]|uniref:hypothetical protein n=1 Tax=Serratia marcescens TaxID=615 RepID=UPI002813B201
MFLLACPVFAKNTLSAGLEGAVCFFLIVILSFLGLGEQFVPQQLLHWHELYQQWYFHLLIRFEWTPELT